MLLAGLALASLPSFAAPAPFICIATPIASACSAPPAPSPGIATAPQDPPAFERDVLPLLQRQGCASAYCHGSATGRGGFKLSLFGSDPDADWRAIAVDLDGRRVDFGAAERSLVLAKPAKQRPHGGGLRLPADGAAHATIQAWIEAGARREPQRGPPTALRARLDGERLCVVAEFLDEAEPTGARDVTAACTFASSDERVATVDADGVVARMGPGEAFVTARYAGADATVRVVVPFGAGAGRPLGGEGAAGVDVGAGAANAIDAAWLGWLAELGVAPAPAASADVLARRIHLDLAGRPPAPHEHAAFVAESSERALAAAVDRLLAAEAFTEVFAEVLAQWFELPRPEGLPPGPAARATAMRQRLRAAVERNEPLDDLAARLLAPGVPLVDGIGDPRDRAEYLGRTFLGLRVGCARCHDHPDDRWRMRDHAAFAALVATRRGPEGRWQRAPVYGENGRAVAPAMLGAAPVAAAPAAGSPAPTATPGTPAATAMMADGGARATAGGDERDDGGDGGGEELFAPLREAVLGADGAFARNVANRLLRLLLGRAPVEPVDDHRASNPATCAPLLDAVTGEYRRTRGDLRALVRAIVTSRVYALTSEPDRGAAALDDLRARSFGRRASRALAGGRLATAAAFVLGAERAPALPDSPLARELELQGSAFLQQAVAAPGNPVDAIADFSPDAATALRELFVLVLSRPPRDEELAALLPELRAASLRADLRRLALALCSTREFSCQR